MTKLRRHGFTLVELLVVIGIIALLISILLPSLARAREAAIRITCASQMRQVGVYISMYAGENRNKLPIGYLSWDTHAPGSSTIWYAQKSTFTNGPVGLGYLFAGGIVPAAKGNAKIFYCPAINPDWRFAFDKREPSTYNPWPGAGQWDPPQYELPLSDANAATWPLGGTVSLKMGYASRSAMSSSINPDMSRSLRWSTVSGTAAAWSRPMYMGSVEAKIRNVSDFNNLAILSDVMATTAWVTGLHRDGVNVMYGNYSVKWVPLSAFKANIGNCRTDLDYGPAQNYTLSSNSSGEYVKIWERFDEQ